MITQLIRRNLLRFFEIPSAEKINSDSWRFLSDIFVFIFDIKGCYGEMRVPSSNEKEKGNNMANYSDVSSSKYFSLFAFVFISKGYSFATRKRRATIWQITLTSQPRAIQNTCHFMSGSPPMLS